MSPQSFQIVPASERESMKLKLAMTKDELKNAAEFKPFRVDPVGTLVRARGPRDESGPHEVSRAEKLSSQEFARRRDDEFSKFVRRRVGFVRFCCPSRDPDADPVGLCGPQDVPIQLVELDLEHARHS